MKTFYIYYKKDCSSDCLVATVVASNHGKALSLFKKAQPAAQIMRIVKENKVKNSEKQPEFPELQRGKIHLKEQTTWKE